MKILHVLDHSVPLHSGYTFRTLAILREQRRRGWQTVHLTSPRQGRTDAPCEDVDGMRFYRTGYAPGALARLPGLWPFDEMIATRRRLEEVVSQETPDILHAHSPALDAWPAVLCGRAHGIPVVYEVRAFWEDAAVDHGTTREGSLRYRLTRQLETMALTRADAVTTICEGLRADIVARGVDPSKVTVIPNAVDVDRFPLLERKDPSLADELGLTGDAVIGFCGSFYGYEGLDLLVSAMTEVVRRVPDARLLLVGGGPQEDALKAQVLAAGLAERVVFTGRVPNSQIDRYYSLIDVLAFPRKRMRLTELVTPLKPLEAMAQGRVVVASDVGGHRELIEDGSTGLLFPAGDVAALAQRLCDALANEQLRAHLAERGRRFVERERNWAASVARYERIYGALLKTPVAA